MSRLSRRPGYAAVNHLDKAKLHAASYCNFGQSRDIVPHA